MSVADVRAVLTEALREALDGFEDIFSAYQNADTIIDAIAAAPGVAVIQLPKPDAVGDFGSVWDTDHRFTGPIGTVQFRPQDGMIEIRDDYEHQYWPDAVERDALVLLAAVAAAAADVSEGEK